MGHANHGLSILWRLKQCEHSESSFKSNPGGKSQGGDNCILLELVNSIKSLRHYTFIF